MQTLEGVKENSKFYTNPNCRRWFTHLRSNYFKLSRDGYWQTIAEFSLASLLKGIQVQILFIHVQMRLIW